MGVCNKPYWPTNNTGVGNYGNLISVTLILFNKSTPRRKQLNIKVMNDDRLTEPSSECLICRTGNWTPIKQIKTLNSNVYQMDVLASIEQSPSLYKSFPQNIFRNAEWQKLGCTRKWAKISLTDHYIALVRKHYLEMKLHFRNRDRDNIMQKSDMHEARKWKCTPEEEICRSMCSSWKWKHSSKEEQAWTHRGVLNENSMVPLVKFLQIYLCLDSDKNRNSSKLGGWEYRTMG